MVLKGLFFGKLNGVAEEGVIKPAIYRASNAGWLIRVDEILGDGAS
jgi:hypothetical protein